MKSILPLLATLVLLAGCLDSQASLPEEKSEQTGGDASSSEPYLVASQEFFAATSGGAVSLPVNLAQSVSDLVVTIDFGSSAYAGFTLSGIEGCSGPGTGVHPNSAQWTGHCGPVGAGGHQLSASFSGLAQGTLAVTAVP